MSRLVAIVLVVLNVGLAVLLFPYDCDGALAVHDGVWYGIYAETAPAVSISPHHPLFHALVLLVAAPLGALGVDHPGHVAVRVIAGLGASLLLIQIIALARPRMWVGLLFAAVLFCTRGYLVEMASGETVLPAAAAALYALILAARPEPNLLAVGAALAVAGLMRQDNVFTAAGVAVALALGRPPGRRASAILGIGTGVLVVVAAGYLAAWYVATGGESRLWDWLLGHGRAGPWTGAAHLEAEKFRLYARSAVVAFTGALSIEPINPILAVPFFAAIVVPGFLLRGAAVQVRLAAAIVATLMPRALFHIWYEANNFEWLVLPIALLAALGAGLARGEPRTGRVAQIAGMVMLAGLAACVLGAHAASTWKLRERNLIGAIEDAVPMKPGAWRFVTPDGRVHAALQLRGIRGRLIPTPVWSEAELFGAFLKEVTERPVPTIALWDRWAFDGMPSNRNPEWRMTFDDHDAPNAVVLRREGRAYGVRWVPPRGNGAAESR